jgi:putative ABC transport system substrate-binding protein
VKRREFITLLGGAAAWPLAVHAQQGERPRRIGVLLVTVADDPEMSRRLTALQGGLGRRGWVEGRNLRVERRWAAGDPERIRSAAAELVALAPDVIIVNGSSGMDAMQRATRTVPVVFVVVPDPVGAGYAERLARPGGNATGFAQFEFGIGAKWLELLKEVSPNLKRAGIIRDPTITAGPGQFGAIQSVAPSLAMEISPLNVRDANEIERVIGTFARTKDSGLIVTGSALAVVHRKLIISLAAKYKLPATYFAGYCVKEGGLISYGPDLVDQYRQVASYVDRMLKGEKPADLPVQTPTKFELMINLKTAKALGLDVSPTLLARADEVID